MNIVLVTGPAVEPISLSDAKKQCKADDFTDDDVLINSLIVAARQWAEGETHRALLQQTWRLTLDEFPADGDVIELPVPPLMAVTSITYVDANGDTQTLATSEYTVDVDAFVGRVFLKYGKVWPVTRDERNAVTITFKSGYGTTAGTVPQAIRSAILLRIADLYENREGAFVGTIHTDNPTAMTLLAPYLVRSHP